MFISSGESADLRKSKTNAAILVTSDDGRSWTQLYRNKNPNKITTMSKVNKNLFFALTDKGILLRIERISVASSYEMRSNQRDFVFADPWEPLLL